MSVSLQSQALGSVLYPVRKKFVEQGIGLYLRLGLCRSLVNELV